MLKTPATFETEGSFQRESKLIVKVTCKLASKLTKLAPPKQKTIACSRQHTILQSNIQFKACWKDLSLEEREKVLKVIISC